MRDEVKICTTCVLPSTFLGISFSENGECNYCQEKRSGKDSEDDMRLAREIMVSEITSRAQASKNSQYDCIIAFSGGKDSTFTLKHIVETYGLRCLAVTIDNGFMSSQARKNCEVVTTALGVDHVLFKPSTGYVLKMYKASAENTDLYAKAAINRGSGICNSCINLINTHVIKIALQNGVGIVAGGYIGGQVPRGGASMNVNVASYAKARNVMQEKYIASFGPQSKNYMQIPTDLIERSRISSVLIINPMLTLKIPELEIISDISSLGWRKTLDTGKNSSNCRLNDLGIFLHHSKYGFSPYVFELSQQVRDGIMTREEALERAYEIPEKKAISQLARSVGLNVDS